jgi:uncharacterized protein YcnI
MLKPVAIAAAIAALAASAAPVIAYAHITLENREAAAGATARLVLRVPHGCEGSATVRLRVRIPDGVVNVKPMPKPGWELTTVLGPLARPVAAEGGGQITEGVREIVWSGGRLLDAHYDEFIFRAQVPDQAGMLYFPTVQECERGTHRWIEIPAEGRGADDYREPAPGLRIVPRP